MKTHWTNRSIEDFVFRIAADFITQLENKMENPKITQTKLARKLGVTKGRVSQMFNDPGNITLAKVVEYAKALNMKVAIVAYEDEDPKNTKGPINSEIFKTCWEKSGKPRDFWAFEEADKRETATNLTSNICLPLNCPDCLIRFQLPAYSVKRHTRGTFYADNIDRVAETMPDTWKYELYPEGRRLNV